jgi:hypothetical protein
MAQQFIDVGTRINDGNGDSLRAGAQKVNANFTELYAALGTGVFAYITAGQGIAINEASGTISLSDNISAPGAITAADDLSTTGQLFVKWVDGNGAIRDGSAILPGLHGDPSVAVTKRYDIGASDKEFRDIYTQRVITSGAIVSADDISTKGQLYVRWTDDLGVISIGPAILPGLPGDTDGSVNDKYDIGSSLRRFRTTYSDLVGNVTGNVTGNVVGVVTGGLRANAPIVLANLSSGQRDLLPPAGQGALIYNTTTFRLQFWNGTNWGELSTTAPPDATTLVGTTIASNVIHSSLIDVGTLTSLAVAGATTVSGTINANGTGGIATTQTTFNLVNDTATTVNFAGAATSVAIGYLGGGTTTVNNNLTVIGNLTVNGAVTTVNSTTYTVDDKNIEIASVDSPTDTTADGAGITIKGATDKTILWDNANANFTSSEHWNIVTGKKYKINNVDVLTSTALGSGVVGSSLTSVGTLTSLTTSGTLAANGSSGITTTQTTFPLVNTIATTVNFAGAATVISIGATTGTTTINNNTTIKGNTLIGISTSANFTRFPNANVVISNTSDSIQQNESHNIGLVAEGTAKASDTNIWGIGVYGAGYTNTGTRSGGVVGEGHVSATSDTGSAIGVRGYANDTHAGGMNIGLFGDAANSATGNYALYINNGDIYLSNAKTMYLNGNLTYNGNYSVTFSGAVNASSTVTSFFATPNGTVTAFAAATGLTIGGASTSTSIGATTGTHTINNATVTFANATTVNMSAATTVNINGASPTIATSSTGTVTLFNTAATTINMGGAATSVTIGSNTSTTTVQNIKYNGLEVAPANYIAVGATGTYVLSTTQTNNVLVVASTGYVVTLTFPATPADGQILKFTVTTNGCTLSLTAGPTLVGTFGGAVGAPATFVYIYRSSNTTWYRLQ